MARKMGTMKVPKSSVFKVWSHGKDNNRTIHRTELIDTRYNTMFQNVNTSAGLKRTYNRFWSGEAKVDKVKRVNVPNRNRKDNWQIKMKK